MGKLLMSARERNRLEVLGRVKRGELTLVKASELLGLSYRQAKRVYGRYRQDGAASLVHGLRGRTSNRRCDGVLREQVLEAYRSKYADFGPTLASEYLAREDGLVVGVETLRRWLLGAGLWRSRRSRPVHRRWRARKEHCGELVQRDGSHHDWFEGRRTWAVLMVLVEMRRAGRTAGFLSRRVRRRRSRRSVATCVSGACRGGCMWTGIRFTGQRVRRVRTRVWPRSRRQSGNFEFGSDCRQRRR